LQVAKLRSKCIDKLQELTLQELLEKEEIKQRKIAKLLILHESTVSFCVVKNLMARTQLAKVLQIDPANITKIYQELTNN